MVTSLPQHQRTLVQWCQSTNDSSLPHWSFTKLWKSKIFLPGIKLPKNSKPYPEVQLLLVINRWAFPCYLPCQQWRPPVLMQWSHCSVTAAGRHCAALIPFWPLLLLPSPSAWATEQAEIKWELAEADRWESCNSEHQATPCLPKYKHHTFLRGYYENGKICCETVPSPMSSTHSI